MVVNREAIAERVLDGFALPAHQLVPERITGFNAAIPGQAFVPQAVTRASGKQTFHGSVTTFACRLLTTVLHAFDVERRCGSGNRSGHRNAEFDRAIQEAVAEMEPAARRRQLEAVMATAARDLTTIPLYNSFVIMAARAGFTLTPRMDDEVLAMSVRPAR